MNQSPELTVRPALELFGLLDDEHIGGVSRAATTGLAGLQPRAGLRIEPFAEADAKLFEFNSVRSVVAFGK